MGKSYLWKTYNRKWNKSFKIVIIVNRNWIFRTTYKVFINCLNYERKRR